MEPSDTEVLLGFIIKFLQLNAWITELQTTDDHQTIINQNLSWSEKIPVIGHDVQRKILNTPITITFQVNKGLPQAKVMYNYIQLPFCFVDTTKTCSPVIMLYKVVLTIVCHQYKQWQMGSKTGFKIKQKTTWSWKMPPRSTWPL